MKKLEIHHQSSEPQLNKQYEKTICEYLVKQLLMYVRSYSFNDISPLPNLVVEIKSSDPWMSSKQSWEKTHSFWTQAKATSEGRSNNPQASIRPLKPDHTKMHGTLSGQLTNRQKRHILENKSWKQLFIINSSFSSSQSFLRAFLTCI